MGITLSRAATRVAVETRAIYREDSRSSWRVSPLLLILLVGGLLRLALWMWFDKQAIHITDELDYNSLAKNLVQRGEFALTPGIPTSARPPLYPGVLAVAYWLFGLENFQAVRLLQAGLSLLNAVLLYRLGSQVFSPRVGLLTGGLYCFYPSLLGFNNLLLTEVLFTFLLSTACYVLIRALQREAFAALLLAGVLLGLATLTRSVLSFFPAVLIAFLLRAWNGNPGRRCLAAALLAAAFAATIVPWALRNTGLEQTFIIVDTLGSRNVMLGNYRYTHFYRAWDATPPAGQPSWYQELTSAHPEAETATRGQISKLALQEGVKFIAQNPGLTLQRDVVKFFQFWGLERELLAGVGRGYFGDIPGPLFVMLTVLIFGSYVSATSLGVFGAVMAPPSDRRFHWLLLLVIGFICAMHVVTFGHSRYHLPVMPLVMLYSASAWVHARDIWRRRGERAFWLACVLTGTLALWWLWEIAVVDGERYWNALWMTSG